MVTAATDTASPSPSKRRRRRQPIHWAAIRLAYIRGEGSLSELSKRFVVTPRTLEVRCSKEHWVQLRASRQIPDDPSKSVTAYDPRNVQLLNGDTLIAHTLRGVASWLERIEAALNLNDAAHARVISQLVSAWKDVICVGRQALRLDESRSEGWKTVQAQVIDVDVETLPDATAAGQQTHSAEVVTTEIGPTKGNRYCAKNVGQAS